MTTLMIIRLNNGQGVVLKDGICVLNTIERPWIPTDHKGGMNFTSCVPCGEYEAIPYKSDKFGEVFLLYNPDLDVYQTEEEAIAHGGGRWKIIFGHVANKPEDVQGCIGLGLGWYADSLGVSSSKHAVERFRRLYGHYYDNNESFTLEIGGYNE